MGDDRSRKLYGKKCTGTVPKIRNKNAAPPGSRPTPPASADANRNVLSNDLGFDLQQQQQQQQRQRNASRRNFAPPGYFTMNSTVVDEARANEVNLMANGNPPSHASTSSVAPSRRDSTGTIPKCDNVTKYPDKKQIEDKLTQIREYIRVTSSLMATMKNTDEQSGDEADSENLALVLKDLRDSEAKLVSMLGGAPEDHGDEETIKIMENDLDTASEPSTSGCFSNVSHKNDLEQRMESANREIQMLHEQQNTLLSLKLKAENKLREARHIQDKFMAAAKLQKPNPEQHNTDKNLLENDAEELDEMRLQNADLPENLYQQVNVLQQKLNMLHGGESRNDFIQVLDKRDVQLQSEHMELQEKLRELQSRKMQVDQLVSQLQTVDDEGEEDDIGAQVRKICTMKEQLSKLRDMYEMVKNTEMIFESQSDNESETEPEENAQALPIKTDNVIQNQVKQQQMERNSRNQINQRNQEKQINKNARERCSLSVPSSVRNKSSSDSEKLRLQAELHAKKRELEEIMCKHKAGTSNLNHDVGSDGKSEFGNAGSSIFDGVSTAWYPIVPNQHNREPSSERYSSDECPEDEEANDYAELNLPNQQSLFLPGHYRKRSEEPPVRPLISQSLDCERFRNLAMRTPDRSTRSASVAVPRRRQRSRSASKQDLQNKTQVQKQLELIRSVCDSMLDQQQTLAQQQQPPQQQQQQPQFHNNLSPSPLYTEPRQFNSPMNALNTVNTEPVVWFNGGCNQQHSPAAPDVSNYQSVLATNTLQTQAFMLNTLNQCCQMLWLQQRELAALRSSVSMLQERLDQNPQFPPPPQHCNCPPNHPDSSPHYHRPPANNQKTNHQQQQQQQVSSACSMPNLINHGASPNNIDYNNAAAAVAAVRLLDNGLLNNNNNSNSNGMMHGNHHQMWNGHHHQALNNQVAPGNRANNYWDNFRSYSRQNLLSNKTNEAFQQQQQQNSTTSERSNNSTMEWPDMSILKLNPTSTNSSETTSATTPRHNRHHQSRVPPPDVLNVNQIQKIGGGGGGGEFAQQQLVLMGVENGDDGGFVNVSLNEVVSSNGSSGEFEEGAAVERNRNEWRDEAGASEQLPRSKLFEELRENVYKEVATLISANECRPHFLIQLFRDLQFISSDPLRCKALQSLHSLITTSSQQATSGSSQDDNSAETRVASAQTGKTSRCSQFGGSIGNLCTASEEIDREECLRAIIIFLERHGEEFLNVDLFETLKEIFVNKLHIFPETAAVLNALLQQHEGEKISQIRLEILKMFYEMLGAEKRHQDTFVEQEIDLEDRLFMPEVEGAAVPPPPPPPPQIMQNDDLAEADQSHLEMELEEQEEGAVGGVILEERVGSGAQIITDSTEDAIIDFPFNAESEFSELGLDQVPTRLTTNHPRSRSNTPNKDRSSSNKPNHSEHF